MRSRSTIYRVLVRRGMVPAGKRKRRRQDYQRWQRDESMQLWQLDVMTEQTAVGRAYDRPSVTEFLRTSWAPTF
jgi:hypothetical protein